MKTKAIRLLETMIGLSMLVLTALACLQVLLRYGFGASLFWVEEISVMLMIWMAWLGASLLWLKSGHLGVDLLIQNRSPRTKAIMARTTDLMVATGSIALALASLRTLQAFQGMSLGTLDIDASIKYLPIPVGALCLAAAALVNFRGAGAPAEETGDDR
jgi:TRAP-type C4-dicarboxylate transport system permease small subunit